MRTTPLCTSCVQIMTNPICPSCFVRHVNYWLRDRPISQKQAEQVLVGLLNVVKEAEESPADMSCIVCGDEKVNLCTHCFTTKAGKVLEKNLREDLLLEFEEDFNTIIWRI